MDPTVIGLIVFLVVSIIVIVSYSPSSEETVKKEEEEEKGSEKKIITIQSQNVSLSGGITRDCQGSWGDWGSCSKLCGTGKKERRYRITRTKLGNGAECPHNAGDKEEKPCNKGNCVSCHGDWCRWCECSEECGVGTQSREYTITRQAGPGGPRCPHNTGDTQQQPCNIDPCVSCQGGWSAWGGCSEECGGGTQSREYRITRQAGAGGADCPHNADDLQEQPCNIQECRACQGRWVTVGLDDNRYQGCSRACGGGTKTERYEITDEGGPGGTPCEAEDGEERHGQPCNTQECANIHEEHVPDDDHVPTTDCTHLQRSDKTYDVEALNACMNSLSPTGKTYTENTKDCEWEACDEYGYPREDTIVTYEFELNPTSSVITPYCKHWNSWDPRRGTKVLTELCSLWGHNNGYDLAHLQNQVDTDRKSTGNTQGKWPPRSCRIFNNGTFVPHVAKRQSGTYHKQINSIKCN